MTIIPGLKTYTYDRENGVLRRDEQLEAIPVSHAFKEHYAKIDIYPHVEGKTFKLVYQARVPYEGEFVWAVITPEQFEQCQARKRVEAYPMPSNEIKSFGEEVAAAMVPQLLDRLAKAITRNVELELALQELVNLKDLKDQRGETEEYKIRKPLAWGRAKVLVGVIKTVEISGCRRVEIDP